MILSFLGLLWVQRSDSLQASDVSIDGIRLGMAEAEFPPLTNPEPESAEPLPRSMTQANFNAEGRSELVYGKVLKIDRIGTFKAPTDISVLYAAIGKPHLRLKIDDGYLQGWQYKGWWIDCFLEKHEKLVDSFGLGTGRLRWEMSVMQTTSSEDN